MATTADYSSLGRLVAADEAAGGPQTFSLFRAMSSLPEFAGHPGWPEDTAAPSEHQVDELAELGWVRLLGTNGNQRQFVVTNAGRAAWQTFIAQQQHSGECVELDWGSAQVVLEDIFRRYRALGVPEKGVDTLPLTEDAESGRQAAAYIRELV